MSKDLNDGIPSLPDANDPSSILAAAFKDALDEEDGSILRAALDACGKNVSANALWKIKDVINTYLEKEVKSIIADHLTNNGS